LFSTLELLMHRTIFPLAVRWRQSRSLALPAAKTWGLTLALTLALTMVLAGGQAQAQPATTPSRPGEPTLREAFEAAWARQPEAQASAARQQAASAQARAAGAWTPEAPAVQLSAKTDRVSRRLGASEAELGLAVPLWLPGERERSLALAGAEARAVESRSGAARLRVAASVRDAWWSLQRALAQQEAAGSQFESAQRIAADVARRVKAGDLARADQHQADAAMAAAEGALAQAEGAFAAARQHLRALTGLPEALVAGGATPAAELEPPMHGGTELDADAGMPADLRALQDRAAVAEGAAALAATQTRAHPELTITATRDRSAAGEPYQQAITLGLRVPFGAGARHDARVASAQAEATELRAQLALELARWVSEREAARARTEAAKLQLAAADRRARLAGEARGFFDKSFRLGETDLPTRLRVDADAADAARQAAQARIELAAAISAWRQALGLLPP